VESLGLAQYRYKGLLTPGGHRRYSFEVLEEYVESKRGSVAGGKAKGSN